MESEGRTGRRFSRRVNYTRRQLDLRDWRGRRLASNFRAPLPLGATMVDLANATDMNGLPGVEYYDVMSSHVVDTFRIFVGRPAQIEPGRSYPVIYVLDGNLLFQSVRAMQNGMALTRELPEAFVVGIGYDTTD